MDDKKLHTHKERTYEDITEDPATMVTICDHVANGGSLIDLAKVWQTSYSKLMRWIRADSERLAAYDEALADRKEWTKESVLRELRALGHSDLRRIFADDGSMLHPKQWPAEVAAAVAGLEIFEEFEWNQIEKKKELIGHTKKLKLWDKKSALELIGKTEAMFDKETKDTGRITLEQLLMGSYTKEELQKGSHNDGNIRGTNEERGEASNQEQATDSTTGSSVESTE